MKTYSVIIIGAGRRGSTYANEMFKLGDKFKVVGVADPIKERRNLVQNKFGFSDDMCFNSWQDILAKPKFADIAVIATMDNTHYEPALKAIELGYNLLLEKPLAQTAKECADIALAAEKKGVKVLVCHVLRYSPFFKRVKQLIMDDTVGEIMSIVHVEAVGNLHQSHSYIRGNWHSESKTSPMLLAKCCHDIDILQWLLDKPCKSVQSFGSLTHFRIENAPVGAPVRCIDGGCPIENTCPYNCRKLYYESNNLWFRDACTRGIATGDIPTDDEVMQALKTTDYGLCVYHANNDVVDHQTVNMEFDGGATVSLSMNAFNEGGGYIRIFGTKGELFAYMKGDKITVHNFESGKTTDIPILAMDESIKSGHGGGDGGLIAEVYDYFDGSYNGVCAADINISVKNHLIGFAAEKSRHNKTVESIDAFFNEYGMKND